MREREKEREIERTREKERERDREREGEREPERERENRRESEGSFDRDLQFTLFPIYYFLFRPKMRLSIKKRKVKSQCDDRHVNRPLAKLFLCFMSSRLCLL